MSWILLAIVAIAAFLYVAAPLYAPSVEVAKDTADITAYRLEIDAIEAENAPSEETLLRKTYLQRQLLAMSEHTGKAHATTQARPWMAGVAALLLVGGAGLYSQIGRPDLVGALPKASTPQVSAPQATALTPTQTNPNNAPDMETLVAQLGEKLRAGRGDAQGWRLYGRSLMTLRRYGEVEAAYNQALVMSGNDPEIAAEKDSALAYIAEQGGAPVATPGPTADDIAAAQDMGEDDRQAMIQGMVDGLAARLEDEPNDVDGWVRLLRARGVLGQNDQAVAEITQMEKTFAGQPAVIEDILTRSGWVASDSPQP